MSVDKVSRMRGVGRAVGVSHQLTVAVVRSDQAFSIELKQARDNPGDAGINRLNRFDSSFNYTGMTNHVRVSEIQNDQIIICHSRANFVRNRQRAHFRLQIVSRDLGRRYNLTVFAWKRALDSAVKEIGDVRIFFRFGDAQLRLAGGTGDFAQNVHQFFRRKR